MPHAFLHIAQKNGSRALLVLAAGAPAARATALPSILRKGSEPNR